ncbi:unnamed protein product [Merluccius merluccius]
MPFRNQSKWSTELDRRHEGNSALQNRQGLAPDQQDVTLHLNAPVARRRSRLRHGDGLATDRRGVTAGVLQAVAVDRSSNTSRRTTTSPVEETTREEQHEEEEEEEEERTSNP